MGHWLCDSADLHDVRNDWSDQEYYENLSDKEIVNYVEEALQNDENPYELVPKIVTFYKIHNKLSEKQRNCLTYYLLS